jgi:hypothetical protein
MKFNYFLFLLLPTFALGNPSDCDLTLGGYRPENLRIVRCEGCEKNWGVLYETNAAGKVRIAAIYNLANGTATVDYKIDATLVEQSQINQLIQANGQAVAIKNLHDPQKPKLSSAEANLTVSQTIDHDHFGQLTVTDQNDQLHGRALYQPRPDHVMEIDYYFGTSLEAKEQIVAWILENTNATSVADVTKYKFWTP